MEIGNALNVVISLLFVYLLLSLLTSAFQEMVAGIGNSRGRGLCATVDRLLGQSAGKAFVARFFAHPLIAGLVDPGVRWLRWLRWLFPSLGDRLPSYIAPETFSQAVLDVLRQDGAFRGAGMHPALAALWRDAGQDLGVFREKVKVWFQGGADVQTGVHKRATQRRLLVYGFVIAAALNIDTISITTHLWTARATQEVADLAAKAIAYRERNPQLPGSVEAKELLAGLEELKLPIGWDTKSPRAVLQRVVCVFVGSDKERAHRCGQPDAAGPVPADLARLLGWLLTALAISVGAQFWFDTLGRIIGLRAAGPKPEAVPKPTPAASGSTGP